MFKNVFCLVAYVRKKLLGEKLIKLDAYFDGLRHGAENAWTYFSAKKGRAEFVNERKMASRQKISDGKYNS